MMSGIAKADQCLGGQEKSKPFSVACWIELAVLGGEWRDALQRLTNRCRETLRHSLGYVNKCNRYLARIATFIYILSRSRRWEAATHPANAVHQTDQPIGSQPQNHPHRFSHLT